MYTASFFNSFLLLNFLLIQFFYYSSFACLTFSVVFKPAQHDIKFIVITNNIVLLLSINIIIYYIIKSSVPLVGHNYQLLTC